MFGALFERAIRVGGVFASAALVAACTQAIHNDPVNLPLTANPLQVEAEVGTDVPANYDDTVVALSFSGGGSRAAAFSYGVLQGFEQTRLANPQRSGLAARPPRLPVRRIGRLGAGGLLRVARPRRAWAISSSVSSYANAEEGLQTEPEPRQYRARLARRRQRSRPVSGLAGRASLRSRHLQGFLSTRQRPRVWINASDIYNRTFVRVRAGYVQRAMRRSAQLSGVARGRRFRGGAGGVHADRHSECPGGCPVGLPAWVERARSNPNTPPLLKAYADALERYRSGEIKYVKLLDGGLVDNYGLAGFTIARLASDTPFGPLAPQEAVKLRRFLSLLVDSGRAPSGKWAQTIPGPSGVDLIMATSDTATESGAIGNYSAFDGTMNDWSNELVRWRCGYRKPIAANSARRPAGTAGTCSSTSAASASINWDRTASGPQRRRHALQAAAPAGRIADPGRPRRAIDQSEIPRLHECGFAREAAGGTAPAAATGEPPPGGPPYIPPAPPVSMLEAPPHQSSAE